MWAGALCIHVRPGTGTLFPPSQQEWLKLSTLAVAFSVYVQSKVLAFTKEARAHDSTHVQLGAEYPGTKKVDLLNYSRVI